MTGVSVYLYMESLPYQLDTVFDYLLPDALISRVKKGSFVYVPFGSSNKITPALVASVCEPSGKDLKAVLDVYDGFSLNEEMLGLVFYMREQFFCTVSDVLRCILPPGIPEGLLEIYVPTERFSEYHYPDGSKAQTVQAFLAERFLHSKKIPYAKLRQQYGSDVRKLLRQMENDGILVKRYEVDKAVKPRMVTYYTAVPDFSVGCLRSDKQKEIYEAIRKEGKTDSVTLRNLFGNPAPQLKRLLELGALVSEELPLCRLGTNKRHVWKEDSLTEEQQKAKDTILSLYETGQAKAALLYGVTGSGKTCVMKAVADQVVRSGKSVIILVPEISLTPQTVGLFSSLYGNEVAVLHSGLSAGEKQDAWQRMREGSARICIGTRSAVFAPFTDIGMIIIDEEQEHTYKSDMTPRYHARDIARYRCASHNAVMLLASATPSVESYYKAEIGSYTLVELKERYNSGPMPKAILCDMRGSEGVSPVGELLQDELSRNLDAKQQSILFVGRRGYHNFALCTSCGATVLCPKCSVSMTCHTARRPRGLEMNAENLPKYGYMMCHYCGKKDPIPEKCPACGASPMQFSGYGTQKVEKELAESFPDARILRVDADTTGEKEAFDKMLSDFRDRQYDMMLGTQMVTKGHNFPAVTLVGVVMADNGLYMDDYRAAERTFSLVTQVVGRAGRGELPGRAIIQTYNPDNQTLTFAAAQNYREFYKNEIALRKALLFPPFCDIALVSFSCEDEQQLKAAVAAYHQSLQALRQKEFSDLAMVVFGPFEAPIYKLNERYRMRFVMKVKNNRRMREFLRRAMSSLDARITKKVQISVDMNPGSL